MKNFVTARIESPAFEPDSARVAELTMREAISRPFEVSLHVVSLEDLDEAKLLTSPFTLVFERALESGGPAVERRRVHGIVRALVDRSLTESKHREYHLTMVPRLWQASLSSTSDVCMDMSIPDIIKKKLAEGAGLNPASDIEMRLRASYAPREFVVQYQETNLAFASRLAEDLGICFFFEEKDGKEHLVFADDNAAFRPAEPASAPFAPRGDTRDVYELSARREIVSKIYVERDYNYRNPAMDVKGEAQAAVLGHGKIDEYGPHAKTPEEATFYARVRAEEAATRHFAFEGRSDLPGLSAGSVVKVEGHARGDLELLITEVVHELSEPVFGMNVASERPYRASFRAIPRETPYRPARLTPKPVAHGVVTGIVESGAPTDFGAVDDHGRYRVMFMYDSVAGRGDGKASRPLRMAQSSAGSDRGFHAPLKPGTEVLVSCMNGDPDRPVIVGAVNNPQTPSPVAAANAEKSIWRTNKSSIAIDDQSPRCKISVEDTTIQVGSPEAPEDGILFGTAKNVSEVADEAKTESNKSKAVYTEELQIFAKDFIVQAAGVTNPLSLWQKKAQEIKDKAQEFIKKASEFADKFDEDHKEMKEALEKDKKASHEHLDKAMTEAKAKSAERMKSAAADAARARENLARHPADPAAQQEAKHANDAQAAALAQHKRVEENRKPKTVLDPVTGNVRPETAEEAAQRSFKDELRQDPEARKAVKQAADEAVAAQEALDDFEQPKKDLTDKDGKVWKEFDEKTKQVQEIGELVAKGDLKGLEKKLEEKGVIGGAAAKVASAAAGLKQVEEAIKKSPVGKKLISVAAQAFGKAASKALDAAVAGSQKLSMAIPKSSGERKGSDVGTFGKPYNIQSSRDSASLYALKDAFVFGRANATMASINAATVIGAKRADLKSRLLVEVAAADVFVSSKKHADVYSGGTVLIVAKSQGVKVPDAASVMINGQKDVHVVSDDKSVHVKANENVSVFADNGNLVLTAKKKDFLASTQEGKLEIEAVKGTATLASKEKLTLQSKNGDVALLSDKGNGTIKTKGELKLNCKEGAWKASGDIEVKGSNVGVKGSKVTVKASKIELG